MAYVPLRYALLGLIAVTLFFVSASWIFGGETMKNLFWCTGSHLGHLNPVVVCGDSPIIDKRNYVEFKSELTRFIQEKEKRGEVSKVSVYFRDLQYGPTFGVDEYQQFSPASLLKLPLMITLIGLSEDRPDILDMEIYFEGQEEDLVQSIPPRVSAKAGIHYTIRELIGLMIKYSDNNAYYALLAFIDQISPDRQALRDTFIDLGIIDPRSPLEETITVKSYAGIFTQLFNATYFSDKETSELALEFLTDTDFVDGLVAGVPAGVRVAHKFGERFDEVSQRKQLHDCGIVYYPKNPYLLCIMTKGQDIETLKKVVAGISRMVYEEFDSRRL